jgi:DNA polymerase III gamma/tau subunit
MNIDPQVAELGVSLGEATIRNTFGAIQDRIRAAKAKQNAQATINGLEEIINSLIEDKNELTRIAEEYKQVLVAQQITPEEIKYITESLIPRLKELIEQTPRGENDAATENLEKAIDALTPLLSVEMLTVFQLVGFNFKKAIGEPLTLLLQKFITSRVPADPQSAIERSNLALKYNTEALKVAQDKDASERFERLRSNGIL